MTVTGPWSLSCEGSALDAPTTGLLKQATSVAPVNASREEPRNRRRLNFDCLNFDWLNRGGASIVLPFLSQLGCAGLGESYRSEVDGSNPGSKKVTGRAITFRPTSFKKRRALSSPM